MHIKLRETISQYSQKKKKKKKNQFTPKLDILVLHHVQVGNFFSHVEMISHLPGLKQY